MYVHNTKAWRMQENDFPNVCVELQAFRLPLPTTLGISPSLGGMCNSWPAMSPHQVTWTARYSQETHRLYSGVGACVLRACLYWGSSSNNCYRPSVKQPMGVGSKTGSPCGTTGAALVTAAPPLEDTTPTDFDPGVISRRSKTTAKGKHTNRCRLQ